jgi:hypothetical protein
VTRGARKAGRPSRDLTVKNKVSLALQAPSSGLGAVPRDLQGLDGSRRRADPEGILCHRLPANCFETGHFIEPKPRHARELSPGDDSRSLWKLVPVRVLVGLARMGAAGWSIDIVSSAP